MAIVTIIGAGMIGSALVFPAGENGNQVRLVGTPFDRETVSACRATGRHPKFPRDFPADTHYYQAEEMDAAIPGSDLIIGGISSFGIDWFRDVVLPKIPDEIPVLLATKGLQDTPDGKLLTYLDILQQKLNSIGSRVSLNAMGGPCISHELVAGDHTVAAFCGKDLSVLRKMKAIMETDYYHVLLSLDTVGIETAVALKNAYALGIALTIGLNQRRFGPDSEPRFNSQATVFGQAIREISLLLDYQGGVTPENLSIGVSDLFVTVCAGRTRLAGILLGQGKTIDEVKKELNGLTLESLIIAVRVARVIRIAASKGLLRVEDFPLLMHVDAILSEGKPAELPWEEFSGQMM